MTYPEHDGHVYLRLYEWTATHPREVSRTVLEVVPIKALGPTTIARDKNKFSQIVDDDFFKEYEVIGTRRGGGDFFFVCRRKRQREENR